MYGQVDIQRTLQMPLTVPGQFARNGNHGLWFHVMPRDHTTAQFICPVPFVLAGPGGICRYILHRWPG